MEDDNSNCKSFVIDFVVLEDDPEMAAVEDEIRDDLSKIGIEVKTRFLDRESYGDVQVNGDYNMFFSRTWGAPYDPHSYLLSWAVPSHVEYTAIANLAPPLTRDALTEKIANVQTELDEQAIGAKWREILEEIHHQALVLPLWGTRVPYVVNRRLLGFTPGDQLWAYPLNNVRVSSGSANVTIAPGAASGMFKSVGPLNPHQYFPNELFASYWVYEGLVSYGQDGEIVPALATSWSTESMGSGQRVTFILRDNVKFHDGTDFNCTVAKLNFDHVMSETVRQRHQWYGIPQHLESWSCTDDGEFVLETATPFYPLLQELTYVRPLVFASANAFAQGVDSHPEQHNSCEPGMFGSKWDYLEETVTCLGLKEPIGTGPFKFVNREFLPGDEATDAKVIFARNEDYWGTVPEIEFLEVQYFENNTQVEAALLSGELDMALGVGPLTAHQVQELKFSHSDLLDVRHSDVTQNALLVMNTGKAPTDDINVRKAIIHAVNKARFIEDEFAGLEQPASQLLPMTAPYCDVDLSPKWNYDLDKAKFLNCPATNSKSLSSGAIIGITASSVVAVLLLLFVGRMIHHEKKGQPLFAPIESVENSKAVEA